MIFRNQKIQKFITAIILVAVIGSPLLVPKKAEAGIFGDIWAAITAASTKATAVIKAIELKLATKKWLKDVLNEISKAVARRVLPRMTESTINWINSGFQGAPLFLENPDSFFNNIVKYEIRNLVGVFGYDSRRFPYGRQSSLNFINAYKRQLDVNAAYSLSSVIRDAAYLRNYRSNFNIGGWNGFLLHTQYPQNNAIGFQMLATEELARRINADPAASNEIGKVKSLLQQGQGFLSPQVCSTNKSLVQNPYNPPTFKFTPPDGLVPPEKPPGLGPQFQTAWEEYERKYNDYETRYAAARDAAKATWTNQNTCTGQWITITPGAVVASQITNTLNLPTDQTKWAGIFGGSLSAILDSLFAKLFNSGLNALASKRNPPPDNPDNWDYLGNTLGSPASCNPYDDSPFGGPDEEIVLGEFRTVVEQGISATQEELRLLDNPNSIQYGAVQYLSAIWPKVRDLDICLPGPNLGWEERLDDELGRASNKIQEKMNDKNAEKASQATLVFKELKFAVSFFKDWMRTKTLFSLPSASEFLDAIKETETFDEQIREITNVKRSRLEALARLMAISGRLNSAEFTVQPESGTLAEKNLISLRKQYDAIRYSISNTSTLNEAGARLGSLQDKLTKVNELVNKCVSERQEKGWNIPTRTGNPPSSWNDSTGESSILRRDNNSGFFASGTTYFGRYFYPSPSFGGWTSSASLQVRAGTEKEQFCSRPISGGYTHDVFINPNDPTPGGTNVEYKQLPLVNTMAKTKNAGTFWIILSCNIIFRSSPIDYKGNIPGKMEINEPPPSPDDTGESGSTDAPPPACDPAVDPNCVPPPPPPPPPCDPATDPNCIPADCGGAGQIACS